MVDEVSVVSAENLRQQRDMNTEMKHQFRLQGITITQIMDSQKWLEQQFHDTHLRIGHEFEQQRHLLTGSQYGQEETSAAKIESTKELSSNTNHSRRNSSPEFMHAILEMQR